MNRWLHDVDVVDYLCSLAEQEGVSINQLVTTALAEKLAALMTVEYLEERGTRGDRAKFDRVLRKVKNRPVGSEDELK